MKRNFSKPETKNHRIRFLNSFCIEYVEDDHVMLISVDLRQNRPELSVERKGWDYPYESEIVDKENQFIIQNNILEYLLIEGFGKPIIQE